VSFAGLPPEIRQTLRQQALAVTWKVDGQGRCQVERKEEVKKRLGRSPDDMDAVNLAYREMTAAGIVVVRFDDARRERRGFMDRPNIAARWQH